MSGDRVVARIENPATREARIVKIVERQQKRVAGTLRCRKNICMVEPKGKRMPFNIYIRPAERGGARNGDLVVVELTSYPTATNSPEGRVVRVMPEINEPKLDIDLIMEEYSFPSQFSSSVKAEVRQIDRTIKAQARVDCRELLTVTIDGEKAKDFDDAVSIKKDKKGYTLWVHIADVSHYVPWDSAIDLEARDRGTSFYAPDRVIPMLPKELSNNLCSLVPKSDRLTFTIEMHFDTNGRMLQRKFYPSIINSNEKMTYTSVKRILVDADTEERKKYSHLIKSFENMAELCEILKSKREARGSLDFDLPEPEILLDLQGRPEAILKAERDISHSIIEEFMIAANEAVASYLEGIGVPLIYRVHEEPD
jgi:ribonuclease R